MVEISLSRRILIVEDEVLLALELKDLLTELGHEVVGHAARVDKALSLAGNCEIDFAILDINVAGAYSFPVADALRARGIPFIFVSGYGTPGLTTPYKKEQVLNKPYLTKDLQEAISHALKL